MQIRNNVLTAKWSFKKKVFIFFLVSFFLITILSFLSGPLFPWSPLKPDYAQYEGKHYAVYYSRGTSMPDFYKDLDPVLGKLSNTYNLTFHKKIKLIRTSENSLKFYLPWIRTEGIGGAALQTGDVLYINYEQIQQMDMNEEEFVNHEVTHLLQHQNTDFFKSFTNIPYITEGTAVYFGGPRYFTSKDAFYELANKTPLEVNKNGNAIFTDKSFAKLNTKSGERVKFVYTLYGEFISYLINTYGNKTFNAFYHNFLEDPENHRELFQTHFDISLTDAQNNFIQSLKQKKTADSM